MEGLVPLDVVIHILNLVVLFVILRLLVYKPVKKFMDARTQRLEEEKEKLAREREEVQAEKEACAAQLSSAQADQEKLLTQARADAAREKEAILADARRESEELISAARQTIREEEKEAGKKLEKQTLALAGTLARKIMAREINESDNEAAAERFFREMEHHD